MAWLVAAFGGYVINGCCIYWTLTDVLPRYEPPSADGNIWDRTVWWWLRVAMLSGVVPGATFIILGLLGVFAAAGVLLMGLVIVILAPLESIFKTEDAPEAETDNSTETELTMGVGGEPIRR